MARGAAYADFDRDGDLDVLVTDQSRPGVAVRNDGGNANHWLRFRLAGHEVQPQRSRRGGARRERVRTAMADGP